MTTDRAIYIHATRNGRPRVKLACPSLKNIVHLDRTSFACLRNRAGRNISHPSCFIGRFNARTHGLRGRLPRRKRRKSEMVFRYLKGEKGKGRGYLSRALHVKHENVCSPLTCRNVTKYHNGPSMKDVRNLAPLPLCPHFRQYISRVCAQMKQISGVEFLYE